MDNSVYVLMKGTERVSLADHKSLIDLSHALLVLGCTEEICQKEIKGNKQAQDSYEISFLDKHIQVIGMADVERVVHWILSFKCNKISIEKAGEDSDDRED